ncbi:hypothetical protein LX36DRAFT_341574 [Colletotrichum falcatum]|nr:hypothetical protein LX36DRAFT_341574 [Colletotrichum falcatum]
MMYVRGRSRSRADADVRKAPPTNVAGRQATLTHSPTHPACKKKKKISAHYNAYYRRGHQFTHFYSNYIRISSIGFFYNLSKFNSRPLMLLSSSFSSVLVSVTHSPHTHHLSSLARRRCDPLSLTPLNRQAKQDRSNGKRSNLKFQKDGSASHRPGLRSTGQQEQQEHQEQ